MTLSSTNSAHLWTFKPSNSDSGLGCYEIFWGDSKGHAILDQHGSFSVKHRASTDEEHKYFMFFKIPEQLKMIADVNTLKSNLRSLYVKPVTKRQYTYRQQNNCKGGKFKCRNAGRKVRNIEVENYVLRNMQEQSIALKYPDRKSCVFWAEKWMRESGKSKYEEFKASKGWCDKFLKRNQAKITEWRVYVERMLHGNGYDNSTAVNMVQSNEYSNLDNPQSHAQEITLDLRMKHSLVVKERIFDRPIQENVAVIASTFDLLGKGPPELGGYGKVVSSDLKVVRKSRSLSVGCDLSVGASLESVVCGENCLVAGGGTRVPNGNSLAERVPDLLATVDQAH